LRLNMPIGRTINKVINGELTQRLYAGLRHLAAGNEAGPW
jgi:hypothetical protein